MKWIDFKEIKPLEPDFHPEGDAENCWIAYRYVSHPQLGVYVSGPTRFSNGMFDNHVSSMNGKSPECQIEVLYWCVAEEVVEMVGQNFKNQHP